MKTKKVGRPAGTFTSPAMKALIACPVGGSFLVNGVVGSQAGKAISLRLIAANQGIKIQIRPEGVGKIRVFRVNAGSVGVRPQEAPAGVRFARKAKLIETRGRK